MKICKMLKEKDIGAIGIGAMIVFISMVLVAGIAASVLIQTSTRLESQAMSTGQETIAEVATGLAVFDIVGYASSVSANLSKVALTIRPRAGSTEIDLASPNTIGSLTVNGTTKGAAGSPVVEPLHRLIG